MATTIAQLIEKLKEKDQAAEVEFIVLKTDGELVTMDVAKHAKVLIKMLKLFASA